MRIKKLSYQTWDVYKQNQKKFIRLYKKKLNLHKKGSFIESKQKYQRLFFFSFRISQTSAILNQTDLCFQSCEKFCQLYEVYQNKKEIHNASLETSKDYFIYLFRLTIFLIIIVKTSLEKKISQAKEENIIGSLIFFDIFFFWFKYLLTLNLEKQKCQQLRIEDGIEVERKKFMFDLFQRKSLEFEALVKEENEVRFQFQKKKIK